MTIAPRQDLPTARGRQLRVAIDGAAGTGLGMIDHAQREVVSDHHDPHLTRLAAVAMLDSFCRTQSPGGKAARDTHDDACISTPATTFHRAIDTTGAGRT